MMHKFINEVKSFLFVGVIVIFGEGALKEIQQVTQAVKKSFLDVRSEMDDHLVSINQNTSEIQSQFDYLRELDAKIDKLTERVDELFMLVAPEKSIDFSSVKLTRQEQEVYVVLASLEGPCTPEQVGKRLGLSKQLAGQYLYNLQLKGIPMMARNWNGEMFYSLDLKFKDLQERKNVLKISSVVMKAIKVN